MSESKIALYKSGWEPTCGRSKKYDYVSPIAGEIKVDGTWELLVCRCLDRTGLNWVRNRKRFPYVKDGVQRTYQPDFYVSEWDTYIEVKGYQTALDECKWSQFNHRLVVWKKDTINELVKCESQVNSASLLRSALERARGFEPHLHRQIK